MGTDGDLIEHPIRNGGMMPYEEADIKLPGIDKWNFRPEEKYNKQIITEILEIEQPITDSYLCKRLAKIIGFSLVSANIQKAVKTATFSGFYKEPLVSGEGYCLWLNKESAANYTFYRNSSFYTYYKPISMRPISEIPDI